MSHLFLTTVEFRKLSCDKQFLQNGRQLGGAQNSLSSKLYIKSAAKQETLLLPLCQIPDSCKIGKHLSLFQYSSKLTQHEEGLALSEHQVNTPHSSFNPGTFTHFKSAGISKQGS